MDADLIRLILLLLGISLVAGIWLWDRRQRRDDNPMAWREPEGIPEPEENEATADIPVADDAPEAEISLQAEPQVLVEDVPVVEPPAADETPAEEADITPEPEPKAAERKPAWLEPGEPVIPAFLLNSHSEPLFDRPAEIVPETPAADLVEAADVASELAWIPDSVANTDFTAQTLADTETLPDDAVALDTEVAGVEPDLPVLELEAEPIHAPAKPRQKKSRPVETADSQVQEKPDTLSVRMDEDQFDLDLGFSAVDEQDLQEAAADLPELIVQINVVAKRGQPFTGEQILAAMDQVEMKAGEHDIFHRHDNQGRRKVLFSLASLVEPGSFPLKKMKDFSTPGLSLFAQLPGPRDGLLVYSDMLYVAERLARLLDARLKDENRSALTKQTIEHTRGRIAEHKRQITLKLRERDQQTRGRR